jgi:two-component system, NarL family, response regulator NreC
MKKCTVLLADDHAVVRKGLRFLLDQSDQVEVIGEAADGRETVSLAQSLRPDLVIVDIQMPNLNGIDAAAQIVKDRPQTAVIILSMYSDESYILRALNAGAKAYLLKDSVETDILGAVQAVTNGKPFFSPAITQMLLEDYMRLMSQQGVQDSYDLLTDREKEVLHLLAQGKTNKEVAGMLDLSVYTVEGHRGNLMQKLKLRNTAEIVLYAVRKNIVRL